MEQAQQGQQTQNPGTQMRAITISREYGSGGGEVAARLAQRLGWRLVDHEVVVRVAQELGVSEADATARDERTEGLLSRILAGMQSIQPPMYIDGTPVFLADGNDYRTALNKVVSAAVDAGNVVIVGRGSQVLLAQRRDVLHVRIVTSLERRIPYVMRREGVDENTARTRIQSKDRDRVRYLQVEYQHDPADPHLYDLVINTDVIDLDSAVDLAYRALLSKANHLTVPVEELGPVAGLSRYPGQAEDIRPPESITGQ